MAFYFGLVDRAEDGSFGVWFPDLPGCTSAGVDMDDLYTSAIESVRLWAEATLADGLGVPPPRSVDDQLSDPEVAEALHATPALTAIQVPLLLESGRSVRANISIEAGLLAAIDAAAGQRKLTRSAFLASAARAKIERGD